MDDNGKEMEEKARLTDAPKRAKPAALREVTGRVPGGEPVGSSEDAKKILQQAYRSYYGGGGRADDWKRLDRKIKDGSTERVFRNILDGFEAVVVASSGDGRLQEVRSLPRMEDRLIVAAEAICHSGEKGVLWHRTGNKGRGNGEVWLTVAPEDARAPYTEETRIRSLLLLPGIGSVTLSGRDPVYSEYDENLASWSRLGIIGIEGLERKDGKPAAPVATLDF